MQEKMAEVDRINRLLEQILLRSSAGGLVATLALLGTSGSSSVVAKLVSLPMTLFLVAGGAAVTAHFFNANSIVAQIFGILAERDLVAMRIGPPTEKEATSEVPLPYKALPSWVATMRHSQMPASFLSFLFSLVAWAALIGGCLVGVLAIWQLGQSS